MIEAIHSKLKNQVNIGNFEMRAPHINKSDNEIIGNYRRANTTNPEFKQINSREGEFRISDDRISPDAAVPHQVREESHLPPKAIKNSARV